MQTDTQAVLVQNFLFEVQDPWLYMISEWSHGRRSSIAGMRVTSKFQMLTFKPQEKCGETKQNRSGDFT